MKRAEAGKQQAKNARKELEEITADPNSEVDIDKYNQQTKDENPQCPIGIKAAKSAV